MAKRVILLLAPGFEEIEALAVVDILRRAEATVVIAATTGAAGAFITGRNSMMVIADRLLDDVLDEEFDMVVLPGGLLGTQNLKSDPRVERLVTRLFNAGSYVTAICAATTVLQKIGVTSGRRVTCHPSVVEELAGCEYVDERVVVDGSIITSQGPGTAIEFGYSLVEALYGADKVAEVNSGVLAKI